MSRHPNLTTAEVAMLVASYEQGVPASTIAQGLGIRLSAVYRRLDAAGVPRRPQTPRAELLEDVEHLTATGATTGAIVAALDRHPLGIARSLYRAGRPDLARRFERFHNRMTPRKVPR